MSDIQIVISAQDRASGVVKSVEQSFDKLGAKARGLSGEISKGLRADAPMRRSLRSLGTLMGSTLGSEISTALVAASLLDPFTDDIARFLTRIGKSGPIVAASAFLGTTIGTIQAEAQALAATGETAIRNMGGKIAAMSIPLAAEGTTVGTAIGVGISTGIIAGVSGAGLMLAIQSALTANGGPKLPGGFDLFPDWNQNLKDHAAALAQDAQVIFGPPAQTAGQTFAQHVIDGFQQRIDAAAADAMEHSAQALTGDLATALENNTGVIDDAMAKVQWAIEHPMELATQAANIAGAIHTLEYSRGLASNTPEINTVIDQQLAVLKGQWQTITGEAYTAGGAATAAYIAGMRNAPRPTAQIPYFTNKANRAGMAAGGFIPPYETRMTGERGPELVTAGRRGATVTPNHALGGGPTNVYVDGRLLFQIMDERMGRQLSLTPAGVVNRG